MTSIHPLLILLSSLEKFRMKLGIKVLLHNETSQSPINRKANGILQKRVLASPVECRHDSASATFCTLNQRRMAECASAFSKGDLEDSHVDVPRRMFDMSAVSLGPS